MNAPRPILVSDARYLAALYGRKQLVDAGRPECVNWAGAKQSSGYGQIRFEGRWYLAHRVFWTALRGEIPEGLTIDHLCRNRGCVRVEHMEPVTLAENSRRANTQKKACIHGHPLSGANLYVSPSGRRTCRACRNASASRRDTRPAPLEAAR